MAFTFKERDIRVAIGNNWYVIHMGNASMLDAVAKAKKALNDLDINEAGNIEAGDSPAHGVGSSARFRWGGAWHRGAECHLREP